MCIAHNAVGVLLLADRKFSMHSRANGLYVFNVQ